MKNRLILWCFLCALVLYGQNDIGAVDHEALRQQRRGTEAEMLSVRARLVREDSELRDLNQRITKLQMQLARKLDRHEEIIALRKKLVTINSQLADPGGR